MSATHEKEYWRGYEYVVDKNGDADILVDGRLELDANGKMVKKYKDLPCGHCDKMNTPEGHDGCLGTLPGVMNACCGHGQVRSAYVQLPDGSCLRHQEAIDFFIKCGVKIQCL